jgi:hypothetical protein
MTRMPQILMASLLVALAGAGVSGCKSVDQPGSESFASVRIQGHTAGQIRAATAVVFQQDGYATVDVRRPEMVFEKPGSEWDRITHGSWIDEAPMVIRVRVSVAPVSEGAFEIRCQAYWVQHKGDAVFEKEVRLKKNRSEPYQALLNEVPGRLAK